MTLETKTPDTEECIDRAACLRISFVTGLYLLAQLRFRAFWNVEN